MGAPSYSLGRTYLSKEEYHLSKKNDHSEIPYPSKEGYYLIQKYDHSKIPYPSKQRYYLIKKYDHSEIPTTDAPVSAGSALHVLSSTAEDIQ